MPLTKYNAIVQVILWVFLHSILIYKSQEKGRKVDGSMYCNAQSTNVVGWVLTKPILNEYEEYGIAHIYTRWLTDWHELNQKLNA